MGIEISREMFESFVEVQESGICNMMDFKTVSDEIGCSRDQHREMIHNYKNLARVFNVGL